MGGSLKGVLSVVLCGNWFSDCLYGTKHFQAASGLTRLRQPENQNRTATACRPIAHSIERYHLTKCQQAPQHSITQFSGCLCLSALRQPETQKKKGRYTICPCLRLFTLSAHYFFGWHSRARYNHVSTTVSGFSDKVSMPSSTNHLAKSG